MADLTQIRDCVELIYGSEAAPSIADRIEKLVREHQAVPRSDSAWKLSERDALLITYPDQIREEGISPLGCLNAFARDFLEGSVNGLHVLPFYPSSSDDGFSVIDYRSVDPALGDWGDIEQLGKRFNLMVDAVVNHTSIDSRWFQAFLRDEVPYRDYYVCVEGDPDLSAVIRPRTVPLLTAFSTARGERRVWTTFSADQVDLDYSNPELLLEILALLLFYVERGASAIRLDAIAFVWKEIGTSCLHRPQVHAIVRLIRTLFEGLAPHVKLISETNVEHAENVRYLGDGTGEAHLVYNFALPPLVLHAFHSAQATTLSDWATGIVLPSGEATFFNILATHDGIGLNGARGILTNHEMQQLILRVEAGGGAVSWRSNSDGTSSPYELNANFLDALASSGVGPGSELDVRRFLTAHAIMLALPGVPGIYFHSMFGSRGWNEGVERTGRARSVNREKVSNAQIRSELATTGSLRWRVYTGMKRLLEARRRSSAFSPDAEQHVVGGSPGVFALIRINRASGQQALCMHNVTPAEQRFRCSAWEFGGEPQILVQDLVRFSRVDWDPLGTISLGPYETIWLGAEA